jgi:hypothetical protein
MRIGESKQGRRMMIGMLAGMLTVLLFVSLGGSPLCAQPGEADVRVRDAFMDRERLSYRGYVLEKRYRNVRLGEPAEMREEPSVVEVSYAVLKRHGRVLARFDGVYFGMGNETSFGLFPFLGGRRKQLVVSQDIFRGGRQWIVSLSPRFRVIYDGNWYGTGREADDMKVVDLDHDGVYEIVQPVTAFYGFSSWIPTGRTPLPLVIFKYDRRAGKYLPANRLFGDYLLKDVESKNVCVCSPEDRIAHLSDVLTVVLDYIFAGRAKEAWTFYAEAYKLPDKTELWRDILKVLKAQPVYRLMYGHARKR